MKTNRMRRGFSLLELTLVLVIIGLLAGVAAVNLVGGAERAAIRTTKTSLETVKAAINSYYVTESSYPENLQVLILTKYLEDKPLKDGWDQPFYYAVPGMNGREFTLISTGKDKEAGTEDDIDVWTMNEDS
ncbi:MAG: type II secretion system protein GspG [Phycisphaerales bacterium]|nr:type II secretion system protein GspG [Phycisphaerales bacterium]